MSKHTPGPWETTHHVKTKNMGTPKKWVIVEHKFPEAPYEGDLEQEWGVYPPLGYGGPIALVSGPDDAHLIAVAPNLLEACIAAAHALRSYQYGNGSPDLAKEIADHLDQVIDAAQKGDTES